MNDDRDDEYGEVADDEAAGEPDPERGEQDSSLPRKEAGHPHLILIKPNESEADTDPDDDPPGWPDF